MKLGWRSSVVELIVPDNPFEALADFLTKKYVVELILSQSTELCSA